MVRIFRGHVFFLPIFRKAKFYGVSSRTIDKFGCTVGKERILRNTALHRVIKFNENPQK
jgi:hypothetical protein